MLKGKGFGIILKMWRKLPCQHKICIHVRQNMVKTLVKDKVSVQHVFYSKSKKKACFITFILNMSQNIFLPQALVVSIRYLPGFLQPRSKTC